MWSAEPTWCGDDDVLGFVQVLALHCKERQSSLDQHLMIDCSHLNLNHSPFVSDCG